MKKRKFYLDELHVAHSQIGFRNTFKVQDITTIIGSF